MRRSYVATMADNSSGRLNDGQAGRIGVTQEDDLSSEGQEGSDDGGGDDDDDDDDDDDEEEEEEEEGGGEEEEEEDTEYIILISFTLYSWLHNSPMYSCSRGSRRHQNNPCKEILDCFFYAAPQSLVRRAAATKAARSSV